ncbi:hypothetical protein [Frigoribacterium sp. VKM Ac-2530]|uniref:hypothetical protein n=1 Tax=Frigoribacterium sp. VKM Ac-2530 TaxID=2783822 RepID=UPI00188C271B|nr:hypothetical protein [Frigoribacterium sp. VKM Ac-2530]MBF4578950.1 hypothetical protein [Frigoribacterium sp. VKM Ac-2530]
MAVYAIGMFMGLEAYRDADANRFAVQVVPRIESGQRQMALLTDAYLARSAGEMLAKAVVRGTVSYATTLALRGIAGEDLFRRPFATVHNELARGSTVTAAINAGRDRLRSLVTTGSQLAKTHAASRALERSGVEQYQRVLTGRENCGLCVIASTQRYRVGELLPIHPGCDCGIKGFRGDPERQVINPQLLSSTHDEIARRLGLTDPQARDLGLGKTVDYGDTSRLADFTELVVTQNHGELGPVLAWRGDQFTGPVDL